MHTLETAVLIATRNRRDDLQACLASIELQTLRPDRVIIVDASDLRGDEQELYQRCAPSTQVHHEAARRPGAAYQRNQGLECINATCDFVFLLDDDVVLNPDYCERMIAALVADTKLVGVGGWITNPQMAPYEDQFRWVLRLFLIYGRAPGRMLRSGFNTPMWVGRSRLPFTVECLEGGNCCLRREAIGDLRFDVHYERFAGYAYAEDIDFSLKLGRRGRLMVIPQAQMVHHVSSASRLGEQRFGICQVFNRALVVAKHMPSPSSWACYVWAMLGILLLNLVSVLRGRSIQRAVGNIIGFLAVAGGEVRRVVGQSDH